MKYPSVFFTVAAVWFMVDTLAVSLANRSTVFNLYLSAIVFSVMIFVIGFWRNK